MRRRPPRFNGPFRPSFRALNGPENPAGFRSISNSFCRNFQLLPFAYTGIQAVMPG